jgi:hypothetical protein
VAWSAQPGSKTYPKVSWSAQTLYIGKTDTWSPQWGTPAPSWYTTGQVGMTVNLGAGSVAFDPNTRIGYLKVTGPTNAVQGNGTYFPSSWPETVQVPFAAGAVPTFSAVDVLAISASAAAVVNPIYVRVKQAGVSLQFVYQGGSSSMPNASSLSDFFFLDA